MNYEFSSIEKQIFKEDVLNQLKNKSSFDGDKLINSLYFMDIRNNESKIIQIIKKSNNLKSIENLFCIIKNCLGIIFLIVILLMIYIFLNL